MNLSLVLLVDWGEILLYLAVYPKSSSYHLVLRVIEIEKRSELLWDSTVEVFVSYLIFARRTSVVIIICRA